MTTRRLVRRAFLAAAVSTVSVVHTSGSGAYGFEASSKTASGIQQVQYQPGQASPPPNGTVAQELNRMFQESGQPMPSMHPQDLPNAQGQQSHTLRQNPSQGQTPAPKKNFLQKFMGKITGNERKQSESSVTPPVPPGYQAPTPASNAAGNGQQQAGQNTQAGNPQNMALRPASNGLVRTPNGSGQPAANGTAGTQGSPTVGQPRLVSQPTQPVPAAPASRRTAQHAVAESAVQSRSGIAAPAAAQGQKYVQPGTAPAFMPSQQAGRPVKSVVVNHAGAVPPAPGVEPFAVPPADDGFIDPFMDSDVADTAADSLELDSLEANPSVAAANLNPSTADVGETNSADRPQSTAVASSPAEVLHSSDDSDTEEERATEPETNGPGANPFTGVTLNVTDEEFLGKEPEASSGAVSDVADATEPSAGETREISAGSDGFEGPGPRMEDFGSNLPAMNLPPVEDFELQPEQTAASPAGELFLDLDPEAGVKATLDPTPATVISESTTNPSRPSALRATNVAEASGAPLLSVDAEKLQQSAEQDLRLRQQRLILSRTGQTGFKGFCPVALRDRRDLVSANPEFTATFGLQTYAFSSLAAKTAFEAEPARYSPAAGGSDVVQLVNTGEEQPGLLDYALWHRDRLYLFRSRETMVLFAEDPQRFASQY